ncbi:hypothetical protein KY495_07975 [Massilia sp. PAMC28688]|nr:hypothetical protein KY495_07975 [Massilia sp. PAMC28688]
MPLTFGQVFAQGDLGSGETLKGVLDNGTVIALQLDVKARHDDGSVRHAVISTRAPQLLPGQRVSVDLIKDGAAAPAVPTTPDDLLARGFSAGVSIMLGGQPYTASADALLRSGHYKTWLSGPMASEWLVSAPLVSASGVAHPHLTARFAVRAAPGESRARVDVTLENNWAYEAAPQNFTYDAQIMVGDRLAYSKAALTHFHHARWRKVLWWGSAPQIHIRHHSGYLIATRALPNYDTSVVVSETALASLKSQFTGARTEPMGTGMAVTYMPATGGRPDIGLLPGWAASYLLSMDKRAKDVMLGTADLAGSWSAHYRDRLTDKPVSLHDFPYMTLAGTRGDTFNPATRKYEAFPPCATSSACAVPYTVDASHQPGFAYLPYLVTGDYYYLEELQFWAVWNSFVGNPHYREFGRGLVKPDQVRGQAWALRTIGQAAYISPDDDPLRAQLRFIVESNMAWYNSQYTHNAAANKLGVLSHGYAIAYGNGTGVAPWMDDFFTSAVGHLAELGFPDARPLLDWKVQFPIMRMNGQGACWITGAIYTLKIRDTASAPLYASMEQAWKASHSASFADLPCGGPEMAAALKLKVGEMTGYSNSPAGYPSNMQPALAYAADVGGANGVNAWAMLERRTVKPDYGNSPQFAIIPRR